MVIESRDAGQQEVDRGGVKKLPTWFVVLQFVLELLRRRDAAVGEVRVGLRVVKARRLPHEIRVLGRTSN